MNQDKPLSEKQVIALGWKECKNSHHDSGEKTFTKIDKNGFTTYATLEQINNFYNKTMNQDKQIISVEAVKRIISQAKVDWITDGDMQKVYACEYLLKILDQFQNPPPIKLPSEEEFNGCGDGGCCIQKPIGMHTNGGCKCGRELQTDAGKRAMKRIKQLENILNYIKQSK